LSVQSETAVINLIAERQHLLEIISQLPNLQKTVVFNIDAIAKDVNITIQTNGCRELSAEELTAALERVNQTSSDLDQKIHDALSSVVNALCKEPSAHQSAPHKETDLSASNYQ
jgi:hypothetical protein